MDLLQNQFKFCLRFCVVAVHVVGLAPGPVPAADGSDGGLDLQWNYCLEPKKKRPKEQDFLENNSQISSVDFLQPRSVSTGLGLSLDNGRLASSGDSPFLVLSDDGIERELQRQDAEIDRYLKVQVLFYIKTLFIIDRSSNLLKCGKLGFYKLDNSCIKRILMYLNSVHMDHRYAVYLAIGCSNFGHELFVWFSCLS